MLAISSYRGNRLTNTNTSTGPPTHKHKPTGPITIHCAAASAQCNEVVRICWAQTTHGVTEMMERQQFHLLLQQDLVINK